MKGVHAASGSVLEFPSVSPARMAVTGRQNMYVYFASQAAINAFVTAAMPIASKRAALNRSIEPARLRTLALHSALADGDQKQRSSRLLGGSARLDSPTDVLALVVI